MPALEPLRIRGSLGRSSRRVRRSARRAWTGRRRRGTSDRCPSGLPRHGSGRRASRVLRVAFLEVGRVRPGGGGIRDAGDVAGELDVIQRLPERPVRGVAHGHGAGIRRQERIQHILDVLERIQGHGSLVSLMIVLDCGNEPAQTRAGHVIHLRLSIAAPASCARLLSIPGM
jgi:hypothetical protein